jgi:hypothetical protein
MKNNPCLRVEKRKDHEGGEWDLELKGDPKQLNEGLKFLFKKNKPSFEIMRKALEEVEFNEDSVDYNSNTTRFGINLIDYKDEKNGIDISKTLVGNKKDLIILLVQALLSDEDLMDITKIAVSAALKYKVKEHPLIGLLRRMMDED